MSAKASATLTSCQLHFRALRQISAFVDHEMAVPDLGFQGWPETSEPLAIARASSPDWLDPIQVDLGCTNDGRPVAPRTKPRPKARRVSQFGLLSAALATGGSRQFIGAAVGTRPVLFVAQALMV
jgi:hypothetical protein